VRAEETIMGWCSGTDVFDPIVKQILNQKTTDKEKQKFIEVVIEALHDADWDCEIDSQYWDNPIVRKAFKKLCPKWDWKGIEEDE
jgi:hypothetical protein